ncbi:hypothetical protein L4B83_08415, partial [Streptomyces sp. PSAA01]|nr:hypothetical protein [Streptomyces sp. PSAA01]
MTARPPSGQHPSDVGPGHPPAATTGPAVPGVPPTFLPGRTPSRPDPATAHPAPEDAPGRAPSQREDPASAESAGIKPAPHRESPDPAATTANRQEA